jgi:hypothetical protein
MNSNSEATLRPAKIWALDRKEKVEDEDEPASIETYYRSAP